MGVTRSLIRRAELNSVYAEIDSGTAAPCIVGAVGQRFWLEPFNCIMCFVPSAGEDPGQISRICLSVLRSGCAFRGDTAGDIAACQAIFCNLRTVGPPASGAPFELRRSLLALRFSRLSAARDHSFAQISTLTQSPRRCGGQGGAQSPGADAPVLPLSTSIRTTKSTPTAPHWHPCKGTPQM